MATNGIHHVTAIAGPARRNRDFYTRVLGLRLVKTTVNFDDPGTYHLYYGDGPGRPGTILTFFPWEHVAPARFGTGETSETAFRVPLGAIGYWAHRLVAEGVSHDVPTKAFGETVLPFRDPDGMRLALVGIEDIGDGGSVWTGGGVAAEHAIQGFHGVTLDVTETAATGTVLTDVLGFAETGREGSTIRFASGAPEGGIVQLRVAANLSRGRQGGGSVHHVAFRARDDAAQAAMVERLAALGLAATEQRDRTYFRSVYVREPGGVLFEIATDIPGFAVDEAPENLGEALKLPPGLEPRRAEIEALLPGLV